MKLGLCTIAFRERPLEEVMSIAVDYGFDGIEIWGQEPHISAMYDEAAVDLQQIQNAKFRYLNFSKGG